jgi:hypothetical protein
MQTVGETIEGSERTMLRTSLVAMSLLFFAGIATAGIGPGRNLVSFNIGYATGKAAVSGNTVDGPVFAFNYEGMAWDKPIAFLFSIGWSEVSSEESESGSTTKPKTRQIETLPMYLGAKGYLGKGAFQGHLGAALGLYYSTVETTVTRTGEEYASWGASGWGLGVPAGVTVSIGKTVFINAEYFLNWMWSNDAFDNNILNTFFLGLGFTWGD